MATQNSSSAAGSRSAARSPINIPSVSSVAQRHVEMTDASIQQRIARPHFLFRQLGRIHPDARPAQEPARRAARFCLRQHGRSRLERDRERHRSSPRHRPGHLLSFLCARPDRSSSGEDLQKSGLQKWFERSLLAFGARAGIVYPLDTAGTSAALAIPIDERFFIGGSTTVRSFDERDSGRTIAWESDRGRVLHHLQCRIHLSDLAANC